jgi:hypothetical protein
MIQSVKLRLSLRWVITLNKRNSAGAYEWSISLSVMGRDIKMTKDGGYIIVGNIYIGV